LSPNRDFVGRVYRSDEPYLVGREKLREFATAVGIKHQACHNVAAAQALGYPDIIAAPTFAVVVAQRAEAQYVGDPAAGIDFDRVVHAEEAFSHNRPIVAGDELSTALEVVSLTERAGLATITTQVDITDSSGAPVAQVKSVLALGGAR